MKVNLHLYIELLESEVFRLRALQPKRQGGVSSLIEKPETDDERIDRISTEMERDLVAMTFEPPKNLTSEPYETPRT